MGGARGREASSAGLGIFLVRAYDSPLGHRFTFAPYGVEGDGIELPSAAMAGLQALVGAPGWFVTPTIDFTETGNYSINLGSMPGWYAIPIAMKLIVTEVTATRGPELTVGNGVGVGGVGFDNLAPLQGGWIVASAPAFAGIAAVGQAPLVDLSTPIEVAVVTGATGGSFQGFVAMSLQLFQLPT